MGQDWGLAKRRANQVDAFGQDDETGSGGSQILQCGFNELGQRDHPALTGRGLEAKQARKPSRGSEPIKHIHLRYELAFGHLKIRHAAAVRGLGDRRAADREKFAEARAAVRRLVPKCPKPRPTSSASKRSRRHSARES